MWLNSDTGAINTLSNARRWLRSIGKAEPNMVEPNEMENKHGLNARKPTSKPIHYRMLIRTLNAIWNEVTRHLNHK